MFSKILGKIKSLNSDDMGHARVVEKISKMDLNDMRSYVNNQMGDMPIDEDGIIEVLKKLVTKDEKTSKYYIQIDDMESKIKKALELIIAIAQSKKISVSALELIQEFLEIYDDIISKYDKDNKQIYASKIKDAISKAVDKLDSMTDINTRMEILNIVKRQ